jgi:hypothetical protein
VDRCSNLPFHLQSIADEALLVLQNLSRGYRARNQDRFLARYIRKYDGTSLKPPHLDNVIAHRILSIDIDCRH